MTRRVAEREFTAPVDLCLPNGRLNPAAVGWTRTQLHNTDDIGRGLYGWGRNKRWEYWGVTTPTHILALTVSSLDYAAVHEVWVFNRATKMPYAHSAVSPLGGSVDMPGTLAAGPSHATTGDITLQIDETPEGTRLRARCGTVSFDVLAERPDGHKALGAVVPWTKRLFQYTVKGVARPTRGNVTIDGFETEVPPGESWAVLDHGRGRWQYSMRWNWGAAAGVCEGRTAAVHNRW